MNSYTRKVSRLFTHFFFRLLMKYSWSCLRYYPPVIPDDETIKRWQQSEWPEYKEWIDRHSLLSRHQWQENYATAKKKQKIAKITIVTPVYNTDPSILNECILSVRTQTSPYWEFVLADDGSTKPETIEVLQSRICRDPRIRIVFKESHSPSGISAATNRAIDAASGDYIVFLDHDDRLAPEALEVLIEALENDPQLDVLYSDRDMLSPGDKRFMHLMKPDWSPDNLLGGNYIFHLMCYKRKLIEEAGKLRTRYDGSQDYDLILRCMEKTPRVKHIPKVLYHWRQHENSVSMEESAKSFAFDAGMAALSDALRRRGIEGIVSENPKLWRGNYQLNLPLPPATDIATIILPEELHADNYSAFVETNPALKNPPPFIFIQWAGCRPDKAESARVLASWLELDNIAIASGRLITPEDKIVYAGMIYTEKGEVVAPYSGNCISEPGYMAVTQAARNISAPNPCSVMIRRELWQHLEGFDSQFAGLYSLFDLALRAIQLQWRIVYVPQAVFICDAPPPLQGSQHERSLFFGKWQHWLANGDPFYNKNLDSKSNTYELNYSS